MLVTSVMETRPILLFNGFLSISKHRKEFKEQELVHVASFL